MANEDYEEIAEVVGSLSDYYSDITGRSVDMGIDSGSDIWLSGYRTSGREYFQSLQEAERRLEILYSDFLPDDGDFSDPLEGF